MHRVNNFSRIAVRRQQKCFRWLCLGFCGFIISSVLFLPTEVVPCDLLPWNCGWPCDASCNGNDCNARGSRLCSRWWYPFCAQSSSQPCDISCNVDCKVQGNTPPCSVDCYTPTNSVTINFNVIRQPCNGGAGCGYNPPLVSTCQTQCTGKCAAVPTISSCGPCVATCQGTNANAAGSSTCTYYSTTQYSQIAGPTITSNSIPSNIICGSNVQSSPCMATCNVPCALSLAPDPGCPLMCPYGISSTTYVIPWTTAVTPQYAGAPCGNSVPVTKTCSTVCDVDCMLNYNLAAATCDMCVGLGCPGNRLFDLGTQTCSYATAVPATYGGKPCPLTSTVLQCSEQCCIMQTPALLTRFNCPANCATPTSYVPLYYTPQRIAENLSRRCPTDLIYTLQACSLDYMQQQLCLGSCIVDGLPENPCPAKCSQGSASKVVATATYPITIQSGTGNCATMTTTCDCGACSLDPAPTSIVPCDATCIAYNDRFAYGVKTYFYSALTPAQAGKPCATSRVMPCSTLCACRYTSEIAPLCPAQTTISTVTPWIGRGFAAVTLLGEDPVCNTVAYLSCVTELAPTPCEQSAYCLKNCQCMPTNSGLNVLFSTETCVYKQVQTPALGGAQCQITTATSTCSKACPGCSYAAEVTPYCAYTASTTLPNSDVIFYGLQAWTKPLLGPLSQYMGNGLLNGQYIYPCAGSSVTGNAPCSIVVPSGKPACLYGDAEVLPCTPLQTSSGTILGYQNVLQTDTRKFSAPATCTPKRVARTCMETMTPGLCTAVTYCTPCSTVCPSGIYGVATSTIGCSLATIRSPKGAPPCTETSPTPTTCVVTCSSPASTNTPTNAALGPNALPGPVDPLASNPLLNGFLASGVRAVNTRFGGALYSCGDITLVSSNIGSDSFKMYFGCGNSAPILYTSENLYISGAIFGGNVLVEKQCVGNSTLKADCSVWCNQADPVLSGGNAAKCHPPPVSCSAYTAYMNTKSSILAGMQATVGLITGLNNILNVLWSGSMVEVLVVSESMLLGGTRVPAFNSFNNMLYENTTILINIGGQSVTVEGNSFNYFAGIMQNVTWNFPNATKLILRDTTLYGSVFAPNAVVSGNGEIVGRLYAQSIFGYDGNSISMHVV